MKYIYLLILISALSPSCQKQLTQMPGTTKTAGTFYTNEEELEQAVVATYASLQFTGNFNTGLPAIGELPGEDAYDETPANDNGDYGQMDQFNVIAQNGVIANVWANAYEGIQYANIVLNRIKDIPYTNNKTKNARVGEMKFIRALYYFYLVRTFGNVPLVTDEIKNPQNSFGQERTPIAQVYEQIEKDLTEAIEVLPDRSETNKMRVFKTAAQTLLGKVKLTTRQYPAAETYLEAVVKSNVHGLIDVAEIFSISNKLNKEIIFAAQFASGLNGNKEGSDAYRMFNPTGRVEGKMTGTKGHGVLTTGFYALYTDNDSRKGVYIKALPSGLAYSNKMAVPGTVVEDCPSDWIILRYADVILMLAEIKNELGKVEEAIQYLNMIRNRAGISEYPGTKDKVAVFNEIDLQRRKELVWEGHRWFDLLRQGRAQSVLGITDANKLLMPLPASQTATDGALKQNPGYD